jgi:hypothetical protein
MNRDSVAEIANPPAAREQRRGKNDEQKTARSGLVETQLAASQATEKLTLYHSEERKQRGIQLLPSPAKNPLCSRWQQPNR